MRWLPRVLSVSAARGARGACQAPREQGGAVPVPAARLGCNFSLLPMWVSCLAASWPDAATGRRSRRRDAQLPSLSAISGRQPTAGHRALRAAESPVPAGRVWACLAAGPQWMPAAPRLSCDRILPRRCPHHRPFAESAPRQGRGDVDATQQRPADSTGGGLTEDTAVTGGGKALPFV